MGVSRRDVMRSGGLALAVSTMGAAESSAKEETASRVRARDDRITLYGPVQAPVAVERAFQSLLSWMSEQGWSEYLNSAAGLDLRACRTAGDSELFKDLGRLATAEMQDFAGVRAIQPGDPAMSLLYHALASPDVQHSLIRAYPSPEQIDAIENYIYARAPLPEQGAEVWELAVFAYEYRHSSKTPHRKHADLAYARTGVARTGTNGSLWDPRARSFVNVGPDRDGSSVRVTPARYGLFLARKLSGRDTQRIGYNALDRRLDFLVPFRKLYAGCPHLDGRSLAFAQSHLDEKLARLARHFVELPYGSSLDPDKPPFVRRSASRATLTGQTTLASSDTDLATVHMLGGSAVLSPAARPLVEEAFQGSERMRFIVPPRKERVFGISNRRYSTLKLLDEPIDEAVDFILSDFIFRGGRQTTGLRSPRNGPVFINIRHRVLPGGKLQHIGNTREDETTLDRGGYEAAMFLDGLCDGCIEAELTPGAGLGAEQAPEWLKRSPRPAFSIIAAPDFFPRFDPVDLGDKDKTFLEGGTETASGGRLPANPNIRRPGKAEYAFPIDLRDRVTQTITAVVSADPRAGAQANAGSQSVREVNTLPDTMSNVFAPGWDVTYSKTAPENSGQRKVIHFATFGLGSPFPEDMKLCAAANGMWAGSSPDAARTFYPDLEKLPLLGRPATAAPLTDTELGFHPRSPAVVEHDQSSRAGWDGEHGPYVIVRAAGGTSLRVNYADMMLSDYVVNARAGRFDIGRMRHLTAEMMIERMEALRTCIDGLPGRDRVRSTRMWLVNFEEVSDWTAGAIGAGIPLALGGRDDRGKIPGVPGSAGRGSLLLFAKALGIAGNGLEIGRREQPCRAFYVCRVAARHFSYAIIDGRAPTPKLVWA